MSKIDRNKVDERLVKLLWSKRSSAIAERERERERERAAPVAVENSVLLCKLRGCIDNNYMPLALMNLSRGAPATKVGFI